MSGFDLVPVDGGDPVHLPLGETVLGRGPFLGVSDKRVSRHHGLLQNLDGQLRLKPTHINPCFVQSSLTGDPQPLQKDSWHRLQHGDVFSLLPGQFIFRVVAVGGEECTIRDRQVFEEEQLPVTPELPAAAGQDQDQDVLTAAPSSLQEADRSLKQGGSARSMDDQMFRTRVLPAWMMAAAQSPSSPLKAVKRSKAAAAPSASNKQAAPTQATPPATSLPEEVELSEEEEEEEERRPRKKRRKLSDEEENPQTPTGCNAGRPARSDGSEEEEGRGRVSKPERKDVRKQTESSRISIPAPPKARVRTPCPYGKDCYRKNPVHFQECSHPGDSDYQEEEQQEEEEEEEEAAAADRPECPYGTDCYRKNPLHRKEYKHTRRPARSVRPVTTMTPDDGSEDDDSFINDDSEDGGNDSDYVPPDSEDSGKEDIRRLQREAKTFLQRRK
ncbi:aprataxin and PNK-like factor [Parambassis ranga]|uniref:Aprataxin and PNK-like factor n=1 Tax=Parambassis ranga TaxID=210632 RepID=A0A6P7J1K9_9TELE|nr:aprataxin and PNK-like factor [Parambassis ranga]XP_028270454.1 aprataxin and PNK-like factor [Parambassis ranga]XP_028270461.1 aprataxin and PNK-like factor [Parambassis ranga]XP_028270471.1 aprataxin and PNK-like factor [Parambassis ranga]